MPRRAKPRRLLVEGSDELRLIPHLIEAQGIEWGESRENAIVDIEALDGLGNLLEKGLIPAEIRVPGRRALGILADADQHPASRWEAIRNRCIDDYPDLPAGLPEEGLIHTAIERPRLGVWLWPDNRRVGMLESFVGQLRPAGDDPLWAYARHAAGFARRNKQAPYKHPDKAEIFTWLAWQDPPGRPLHNAIMERILDPRSPQSRPFVRWFRTLFEF